MSASRSKTRSREAAVPPLEIVGRGTTSCVVRTGPNRLVKIVSDPKKVESDAIRAELLRLDPRQRYLAGPLSVVVDKPTEAERDALRRCKRELRMNDEKLDPETLNAAFVELLDAGESVGARKERIAQLKKRDMHVEARLARLTVAQAASILVDTILALEKLHSNGWIHGDVQPHNVAVRFAADGSATARLIDFGMMKSKKIPVTGAPPEIAADHRGFGVVASAVLGLVDSETEPERYRCLRDALAAFKSGTKGLPIASQLRACAAGLAAAPAEAPAGSSQSPGSPSARLGARRSMLFAEQMAETPAAHATPASAARRRERSGEADDGAGPSKTARALF